VEVGFVTEIYDEQVARTLGLFKDQVTAIVHTGSRGLGHQVCDDYIKVMLKASSKYGIELPDRQLCCAPIKSPEGQQYLAAMAAAANFAFANRQMITHWVRESFEQVLKLGPRDLGMELVYDVAHNIAKIEWHRVEGKETKLCVHRKGATRAFAPGRKEVPSAYQAIGQPVLIPGDMGRYSYVLTGTEQAMQQTFGSTCHGAGPGPQPRQGEESRPRPQHSSRVGTARHYRARPKPAHGRRGNLRGLQGRFMRRRCLCAGRHLQQGRTTATPWVHQGLSLKRLQYAHGLRCIRRGVQCDMGHGLFVDCRSRQPTQVQALGCQGLGNPAA